MIVLNFRGPDPKADDQAFGRVKVRSESLCTERRPDDCRGLWVQKNMSRLLKCKRLRMAGSDGVPNRLYVIF